MIQLHHAALTRSVRIHWLLGELGLEFEIVPVAFSAPGEAGGVRAERKPEHVRVSPMGKVPALRDGDVCLFESGAILEYLIERYGPQLAPPPDSPLRPAWLQWVHFSEATLQRQLDDVFSHSRARPEAERLPAVEADARERAAAALAVLEQAFGAGPFLLGDEFSGADVMTGYSLLSAKYLGVLDATYPKLNAYLDRLVARPALRAAVAAV